MKKDKVLFNVVSNLWKNGKNFTDKYRKFYKYYDGELSQDYFGGEKKTAENIVEKIIETKVASVLDAPFTIQVVPSISPLKDISEIKNHQIIADIFNEELHHILNENNFNELKEKVVRYGEIMGFSAVQTYIDTDNTGREKICLEYISPEEIRFDKGAKKLKDLTYIAYKQCLPPQIVKDMYCKNADGSYDAEKCRLIDKITESATYDENKPEGKGNGAVVGYHTENTSGVAYNNSGTEGIQAGKVINLVVMFLTDTSVYAPDTKDNAQTKELKEKSVYMYPNGRMIIFSPNEKEHLILEDKPAPEGFKGLGNIDIFNPVTMDNIEGKSEVEDLIPIQNRINGTLAKMAFLISQNINVVLVPGKTIEIGDDAFVDNAIIKVDSMQLDMTNTPIVVRNEMITEAAKLETMLQRYERQAYEKAKLNETLINGMRQPGTTSAEQVESLNESPMTSIRLIQKNLKNFIIEIGNKIVKLIQEYYTQERIIEISTGMTVNNLQIKYAKLSTDENNQQIVQLYNDAQQAAATIPLNKGWQYTIEVVAGTEIPRSRKELAATMERIFTSGVLNASADIDILEQYLKSLDIPNYRAICTLLRQKQEAMAKNPQPIDLKTVLETKDIADSFDKLFKGLEGFSQAKGQILTMLGLNPQPDTFETAPVQAVTSKSSATDIATIIPDKVSGNAQQAETGAENALEDKVIG